MKVAQNTILQNAALSRSNTAGVTQNAGVQSAASGPIAAATAPAIQNAAGNPAMQMLSVLLPAILSLLQVVMQRGAGGFGGGNIPSSTPAGPGSGGITPVTTTPTGTVPSGTNTVTSNLALQPNQTIPGGQTLPGFNPNSPVISGVGLTRDDLIDYIWAQSNAGNPDHTNPGINSLNARQGSRLRGAGPNEFDAVIARAYGGQFKAYAMGIDTLYDPGDNPAQLAANLEQALTTQVAPEAQRISEVASAYRGDLDGPSGAYNNPNFARLQMEVWAPYLQQNGWIDPNVINSLKQDPNYGGGDVQTIGGAVRILNNVRTGNSQRDSEVRQMLLQTVYNFNGNNDPQLKAIRERYQAVPLNQYQKYDNAIVISRQGNVIDGLLNNYQQGRRTEGLSAQTRQNIQNNINVQNNGNVNTANAINPSQVANQLNPTLLNPNFNFRNLTNDQRSAIGLADQDRAAEHLWGRQMVGGGKMDGGIMIATMQDMVGVEILRGVPQEQAFKNVLNSMAGRIQQLSGASTQQVRAMMDAAQMPQLLSQNFDPSKVLDGSVVLRQPEVDLSIDAISRDILQFGGVTGRNLDLAMAATFQRTTGKQFPVDLNTAPIHFATGPTRLRADANDLTGLSRFNNLTPEEQLITRIWSHDRLMPKANGAQKGQVTGEALAYTLLMPGQALDGGAVQNGQGTQIIQNLLETEMLDGQFGGPVNVLEDGFRSVVQKLYGQGGTTTLDSLRNQGIAKAQQSGISAQRIGQNMANGLNNALSFAAQTVQNHPILTGVGTAGLASLAGVCPFMAATAAAPLAAGLAQQSGARAA